MSSQRHDGDLVRAWLDETYEAERDPGPFLDRLTDEVPTTPQRQRHWWHRVGSSRVEKLSAGATTDYEPSPIPATNGQAPTVIGRTQTMFSPAKAITAGALAVAIGGVLLIAQPFGQQQTSVPGAATDGYIAPVEVTGTSASPVGCRESDYEGSFEDIGADAFLWACSTEIGMPWSMSDARLEGTVQRINEESRVTLPEDNLLLYVAQSAFSIENEGGTWRERPRFWLLPEGYGTYDWLPEEVIVLDGTGDYEGLVAVLRVENLRDFHGFILDERLFPPAPENASAR